MAEGCGWAWSKVAEKNLKLAPVPAAVAVGVPPGGAHHGRAGDESEAGPAAPSLLAKQSEKTLPAALVPCINPASVSQSQRCSPRRGRNVEDVALALGSISPSL